jgi:hypothetical protein
MIGYQFTLTARSGQSLSINDLTTDPQNFVALQEYPVFDVDIKNSEMDKEGQHGTWDFASFYGKRVLTFSGIIIGQDEGHVETLKRRLQAVTALPAQPDAVNDGLVLVRWTDANGDAWQVYAKLASAVRFDRQLQQRTRLSFVMTLKASNPVIEGQALQTGSGILGWLTGSLKLPTKVPAIMDSIYGNSVTVTNSGNAQAHTAIRLYGKSGNITNPAVVNHTTGATFRILTVLYNEAEYIDIDSKTGTVINHNGADLSGLVDSISQYILLNSGDNVLAYVSDETSGANSPANTWTDPTPAAFSINFRDAII